MIKKILRIIFICFFGIQFYLTLYGGFLWPFSSHKLFSSYPEETKKIIQIGTNNSFYLHPGNILDIEYSRCSGLLRNIFYKGTEEQKEKLYSYLLQSLNYEHRNTFDEMFRKINIMTSNLTIEEHLIKLEYPIKILDKRVLYHGNSLDTVDSTKIKDGEILAWIIILGFIFISLRYNKSFNSFLFSQPNVERRYKVFVYFLFLTIFILLIFGPYNSFYIENSSLFSCTYLPNIGYYFKYLKFFIIILSLLILSNSKLKITFLLFSLLFNFFSYYITCFSTTYWITNTNLNTFSLLVSLIAYFPKNKYKSFVLSFAITYISCMYFQAGLAKLLDGGLIWFITGKRIRTESLLLDYNGNGSWFTSYLIKYPLLFAPMGWFTFIFELVLGPMLIKNSRLVYFAILFHFGTYVVLGISFWFIWLLFIPLFFM